VVETVDFFPTEVPLPFLSPKELANQASKQLTRALLNPQPAGPFYQVGDKQMLALQQLAAIFEGALPTYKKDTTPPPIQNQWHWCTSEGANNSFNSEGGKWYNT
jgi:hypothetical protein